MFTKMTPNEIKAAPYVDWMPLMMLDTKFEPTPIPHDKLVQKVKNTVSWCHSNQLGTLILEQPLVSLSKKKAGWNCLVHLVYPKKEGQVLCLST